MQAGSAQQLIDGDGAGEALFAAIRQETGVRRMRLSLATPLCPRCRADRRPRSMRRNPTRDGRRVCPGCGEYLDPEVNRNGR